MSGQQAPSAAARHVLETLELAIQGARAYQREDLAERLSSARRLLADSTVMVHVVGEFKQGKSQLVNALVNAPVCPVDDDIATAVPTVVRYAAATEVALVREGSPPERTEVPVDGVVAHLLELCHK